MKKVLLAVALVALMASSAFATISLDTVGLLGAGSAKAGAHFQNLQTSAALLSFSVTDTINVGVGVGLYSQAKPDETLVDVQASTSLYLNGFMKILESGAVTQSLGLELGYGTISWRDDSNATTVTELNGIYRVAVKLMPKLSMLFDVEVLSLETEIYGGTSVVSNTTILNGAKIGFSVPIM